MAKWFLLGALALFAAELGALLLVGAVVGPGLAVALLFATSIAGVIVLQRPGRAQLKRLRVAVTQSGLPGLEAGGDAFLTVSAGILLLVPGFITDLLGISLLLPPVRRWIGGRFRRVVQTHPGARPAAVVDLNREDWSRVPERALKDRDRKNDPI
jgi:UPF0716 protein FxsA